jgi:endonuclease YncB( thermonuclease family)
MEQNLYVYKALVKEVKDGDTIVLDIDCGFDIWLRDVTSRFMRINAFETKLGTNTTAEMKQKGLQGKEFVKTTINGKQIIVKTFKDVKEKYGRILGEIFYKSGENWINLNDELVTKGFAKYQQYV